MAASTVTAKIRALPGLKGETWGTQDYGRDYKITRSRYQGGGLLVELLVEPAGEGGEVFVAAEEVADHLTAGLGAALLEDSFAVAGAGVAAGEVFGVELGEEVQRDDLVVCVGVVVGRVAGEVAEACVHAVAVDPGPGLEGLVEAAGEFVEVDLRRTLVVEVEGESCVVVTLPSEHVSLNRPVWGDLHSSPS